MKIINDDNENETLRIFNYSLGIVSGSNTFADTEERERIREHVQKRLADFLNGNLLSRDNQRITNINFETNLITHHSDALQVVVMDNIQVNTLPADRAA